MSAPTLLKGLLWLACCTIAGIGITLEIGIKGGGWEPTIFLLLLLCVLGYIGFILFSQSSGDRAK